MLTAVFLGLALAVSLLIIGLHGNRLGRFVPVGLLVVLVAAAALSTALDSRLTGRWHALVVILALVTAALGGNHVTTVVFEAVDEGEHPQVAAAASTDSAAVPTVGSPAAPAADVGSLRSAGQVLRGGAWIGILERLAVFATLVARWPEGIAVVLAVKGLGRYPELRTGHRPGLAERFIIGTLVSVLWAALCAYAATGPALG
jgi:hypothetical protein